MAHLSKEYAESLFMLAVEDGNEAKYLEDLHSFKALCDENPEYTELLSSPGLTREERIGALDSAVGDSFSEYVTSFLKLLCEAGQMKLLGECIAEYEKMYRDAMRKAAVKVTSATELTDDEKRRIEKKATKIVKGECEITYVTDPSIIGGVIIETENAVIDGSLRKSLKEVKEVIKK